MPGAKFIKRTSSGAAPVAVHVAMADTINHLHVYVLTASTLECWLVRAGRGHGDRAAGRHTRGRCAAECAILRGALGWCHGGSQAGGMEDFRLVAWGTSGWWHGGLQAGGMEDFRLVAWGISGSWMAAGKKLQLKRAPQVVDDPQDDS